MSKWQITLESNKLALMLGNPLIAGPNAVAPQDRRVSEAFGAVCTPLLSNAVPDGETGFLERTTAGYLAGSLAGCLSWRAARRLYARTRPAHDIPVIATIAPVDRAAAIKSAAELGTWEQISGILLYCYTGAMPELVNGIVRAVTGETDLPLILRLPYTQAAGWAQDLDLDLMAALLVGGPPPGSLRLANGTWSSGELHSPALVPYYAAVIRELAPAGLPLIARADISSPQDALALFAAGAAAVMLEAAVWVQPDLPARTIQEIEYIASKAGVNDWDAFCRFLRQSPADEVVPNG
ncbi:MAG: hypothetical protein ACYC6L_07320 [Anaerolineae bacterium]